MPLRLDRALTLLRRTPAVADAALQRLAARNSQTLAWQAEVTRIAAPTGQERARAVWMVEQFRAIGWTNVLIDDIGNVIARRPESVAVSTDRSAVWCCAHLDTVFPDVAPRVVQDGARLVGPGIGDNGRGLAAVLALADALHRAAVHSRHDVVFACTVGEEGLGDLRGMRHLVDSMAQPPAAMIAIDGAGDDRIVTGAVGSSRWRVTCEGAGGHSWADFGAPNPALVVAAVASALSAVLLPRDPRTTLTIAGIGGGEAINSIPRSAWLEVDIRSLSDAVLRDLARTLRDTATRIAHEHNRRREADTSPLRITVTQLGERPCGRLSSDAPLVRLAERATRAIGLHPRLADGSTDASIPIARGWSAIAIGAGGRGGGTHTPDEWYDDTHGVRGLERALRIILGAAGTPR
jgi:tripeptide aminopeptidase